MANIEIKITGAMKQDLKRIAKRGKHLPKLDSIIKTLVHRKALELQHKDHTLSGTWKGYRECHIEPDWLLIYRVIDDILYLARTGTHADLFK